MDLSWKFIIYIIALDTSKDKTDLVLWLFYLVDIEN